MNKINPEFPTEQEIEHVLECDNCHAFHFNDSGPCPECGSGIYLQGNIELNDTFAKEYVRHCASIAIQQECKRKFKESIKRANKETIKWIKEQSKYL